MKHKVTEVSPAMEDRLDLRPAFLFLVFGIGALGSFIANAIWWAVMK